jgi:hypothetical protein
MVCFPNRGYKISKTNDYIDISVTSEPNVNGFLYPTYKGQECSKVYLGAYEGIDNSKAGQNIRGYKYTTLSSMRDRAHNINENFAPQLFSTVTYLQCCSLIKYKGKDLKKALGLGYSITSSWASDAIITGALDLKGLNWGNPQTNSSGVKMFGLEHPYGNLHTLIDGCYMYKSSGDILWHDGDPSNTIRLGNAATPNYDDEPSGYKTTIWNIDNKSGLICAANDLIKTLPEGKDYFNAYDYYHFPERIYQYQLSVSIGSNFYETRMCDSEEDAGESIVTRLAYYKTN